MYKYYAFIVPISVLFILGSGCQKRSSQALNLAASSTLTQVSTQTADQASKTKINERYKAVVSTFFQHIDDRKYTAAYDLLSQDFQATHPFAAWSRGYQNTLNHSLSTVVCEDGFCTVELTATENTKTNLRKQRYVIRYSLVDSGESPQIKAGELISTNTVEVLKTYSQENATTPSGITDSVLQIICSEDSEFSEGFSIGSATIIHEKGIILSNQHVKTQEPGVCIAVGVNSQGIIAPDRTYLVSKTLYEDAMRDIWIAQITSRADSDSYPALSYKVCKENELAIGDGVRIFGFPYSAANGNMLITDGIISGINAKDGMIVTSAKVDHGNSGGTAINTSRSCFIGIPTAIRGASEVYGQIQSVRELVKEFPQIFAK